MMFIRRTFLCRYAVIISLVIYVIMFAGILQLHQSPTLEVDRTNLDADLSTRRPAVTGSSIDARLSPAVSLPAAVVGPSTARAAVRDGGDIRDGPTPAAVALALRSPLSMRNEDAPMNAELEMYRRPWEVNVPSLSTTVKTSSTTTKNPVEAAKLDALNANMTLHKANLSDVFRHVEAAKSRNDLEAGVGITARNAKVSPKTKLLMMVKVDEPLYIMNNIFTIYGVFLLIPC